MPLPLHNPNEGLDFTDEEFDGIRTIVLSRTGIDLGIYKDRYMKRRISIRVRANGCDNVSEYCGILTDSDVECSRLLKVVTIHVSQFFRNIATFDKLREEVLPDLFRRSRSRGTPLTIWSVGCAGGEEPYSVAMILREHFPGEMEECPAVIMGSDVDGGVIASAGEGVYGADRLGELPPELLEKYFTREEQRFRLVPEIRRMVSFLRADLLDRDSYLESDLILCRNVLMYFERSHQETILHGLRDSLHLGGYLILGRSETLVGETRGHFSGVFPMERIYLKR